MTKTLRCGKSCFSFLVLVCITTIFNFKSFFFLVNSCTRFSCILESFPAQLTFSNPCIASFFFSLFLFCLVGPLPVGVSADYCLAQKKKSICVERAGTDVADARQAIGRFAHGLPCDFLLLPFVMSRNPVTCVCMYVLYGSKEVGTVIVRTQLTGFKPPPVLHLRLNKHRLHPIRLRLAARLSCCSDGRLRAGGTGGGDFWLPKREPGGFVNAQLHRNLAIYYFFFTRKITGRIRTLHGSITARHIQTGPLGRKVGCRLHWMFFD